MKILCFLTKSVFFQAFILRRDIFENKRPPKLQLYFSFLQLVGFKQYE